MKINIPAYEPLFKENEHLRHGEINIDLGEDVVEVVRCKDCKHAILDLTEKGTAICRRAVLKNGQLLPFNWENKHNDFCSYGERKDGTK